MSPSQRNREWAQLTAEQRAGFTGAWSALGYDRNADEGTVERAAAATDRQHAAPLHRQPLTVVTVLWVAALLVFVFVPALPSELGVGVGLLGGWLLVVLWFWAGLKGRTGLGQFRGLPALLLAMACLLGSFIVPGVLAYRDQVRKEAQQQARLADLKRTNPALYAAEMRRRDEIARVQRDADDRRARRAAEAALQAQQAAEQAVELRRRLEPVSEAELQQDYTWVTRPDLYGCLTKEWLDEFSGFVDPAEGNHENASAYVEAGRCVWLSEMIPVSLVRPGILRVQFIYRGQKLWAPSEAAFYRASHQGIVRAADFGTDWPFRVSAGVLECPPGDYEVRFRVHGAWYSLNGQGKEATKAILLPDANLEPVVTAGKKLCDR